MVLIETLFMYFSCKYLVLFSVQIASIYLLVNHNHTEDVLKKDLVIIYLTRMYDSPPSIGMGIIKLLFMITQRTVKKSFSGTNRLTKKKNGSLSAGMAAIGNRRKSMAR